MLDANELKNVTSNDWKLYTKFEKYFEDFELHMKSIHDNVDERERQLTE